MNIKLTFVKALLLSCLFFVAASFSIVKAASDPSLYFDPATATVKNGNDVSVTLKIDVGDKQVFGADATVTYPSGDLTVKSVGNGGYFTNFTSAQSDGRIELHGFMSQSASQTGSGNFAYITFTSKKDSGGGAVSFSCSSSGETQIYDIAGENVLSCSNVKSFNLTYSGDEGLPPGYSTPNSCNGTCGSNYNCASPLFCYQGFCRNTQCRTDLTCGCKATPTPATKKATPKPGSKAGATPEVFTLTAFTPFPSSTPPEEILEPTANANPGINVRLLGLLTGIGVLIVAIALMIISKAKKKNPPKITPPTSMPMNPPISYPPPPTSTPTTI